jgi:hypothetical protein
MDIRSEIFNLVNDDEVCSPLIHLYSEGDGRNGLMSSGIPFGFGLLAIFLGSYQYLMDAYGPYAASAVCLSIPSSRSKEA